MIDSFLTSFFVLSSKAKSTEPDISVEDGEVPVQSKVVLTYRHSWVRSLYGLQKSASSPWRHPREPRLRISLYWEMLLGHVL